ncbi:hypothetical protein FACS1894120_5390 [Clostridia bacterium]|nr:hypothetical protein FACS1894120_5390 [Clostridia bacterium]
MERTTTCEIVYGFDSNEVEYREISESWLIGVLGKPQMKIGDCFAIDNDSYKVVGIN